MNNINELFKRYDIVLCHSIDFDKKILLSGVDDILFSDKKKLILDKKFFKPSFDMFIRSNIKDKNNIDKIFNTSDMSYECFCPIDLFIKHKVNDESFDYVIIGCNMISYNTIFFITDLAKEINSSIKFLILLEDIVPSSYDDWDNYERTEGRIKKIFSNITNRVDNTIAVNGREVFNV